MKQIIQNMRTGQMTIAEVPAPALRGPGALVQTRCSLISAGTERGLVELAQKSLIGKARQRPDLVKQFMDKVKRDGLRAALATAMERLDRPLLQGYSSAGEVVAVSEDLREVTAGSRVACGGGGYASHAGFVYVPRNLLVNLPDAVSNEEGSFACVGAVAMQGVRIGRLELGERVVVIGLGLIGQVLVQMVRAGGCRVLGCDPDPDRQALARQLGADAVCAPSSLDASCATFTAGRGADAVFIMAATPSNEPLEQAVGISRLRGRIIGVGDFGMHITRKPFYERELEFRMSRSYGPGRYDATYEEGGIDYPPAYVRWTEQRNMASVIDLIAQGKLNVKPLITHRFSIEEADKAYALLSDHPAAGAKPMGILLEYPEREAAANRLDLTAAPEPVRAGRTDRVRVGMIGAGQYASSVLLPLLKKMEDVDLVGVAAATGPSAKHAADKFGFRFCTTDHRELLEDPSINLVMIATRHDLHPVLTAAALRAGKHVFVEKPLSIDEDGLAEVLAAQRESGRIVMVGFNRRFAPLTREAMQHMGVSHGPLIISCRCNAGPLPPDHWNYDPRQGGGRIISEGCHFIDLVCFLDGSRPVSVFAQSIGPGAGGPVPEDNCFITLRLAGGSVASVSYLSVGDKSFSKERVEVFGDGRVYVIEDFRSGLAVRGGASKARKMTQDKGQADELRALVNAIKSGGDSPIPLEESVATSLACIRAVESLRSGMPISLTGEG
jgi:predicted dehydrogenase